MESGGNTFAGNGFSPATAPTRDNCPKMPD
jgi:hypothetical protein